MDLSPRHLSRIQMPVKPLSELLCQSSFSEADLVQLLGLTEPRELALLRTRAVEVMAAQVGTSVYYRGLIELSNVCACDCLYCGIRASQPGLERYTLAEDEVLEAARWCASEGYGSVVVQAGERSDAAWVAWIEHLVRRIRAEAVSPEQPEGLGITLSLGEQSLETYCRWRAAGAHRYLLRIETTDPGLFARIHPEGQTLEARKQAVANLAEAGFQVGTGVMIGLPGQTLEMLARDIRYFQAHPIDMIGMGPWLPSSGTPMADWPPPFSAEAQLQLTLNMIAATRLALPDANIAATTALQAMLPDGRERGLSFGANVTMPNLTPTRVREGYQLYDHKPCLDESRVECRGCLLGRVKSTGRKVAFHAWGDAPRFQARNA